MSFVLLICLVKAVVRSSHRRRKIYIFRIVVVLQHCRGWEVLPLRDHPFVRGHPQVLGGIDLLLRKTAHRYNFSRRVDPDSGLVLRENETVMWVVSRLGLIVIPFSLLNMQLSLYGAAAEAPKRWEIISKMAALGLGFSTLILAKFIAVIVTIGQGMDTRCRVVGFFC